MKKLKHSSELPDYDIDNVYVETTYSCMKYVMEWKPIWGTFDADKNTFKCDIKMSRKDFGNFIMYAQAWEKYRIVVMLTTNEVYAFENVNTPEVC